jgi:hypothetical protein
MRPVLEGMIQSTNAPFQAFLAGEGELGQVPSTCVAGFQRGREGDWEGE